MDNILVRANEDVPAKAIRQAAYKVLGIEEEKAKPSGTAAAVEAATAVKKTLLGLI